MKLLLLDRPADPALPSRREVEFFGPWAQPILTPDDLRPPAFEPYPDPVAVDAAARRAVQAAGELLDALVRTLPELTRVRRGERFWKAFLGHHAIAMAGLVEDIRNRENALPDEEYVLGKPALSGEPPQAPSWASDGAYILLDASFRLRATLACLRRSYPRSETVAYTPAPREVVRDENALRRWLPLLRRATRWSRRLSEEGGTEGGPSLVYDFEESLDPLLSSGAALRIPKDVHDVPEAGAVARDPRLRAALREALPAPYGELLSWSLPSAALEGLSLLVERLEPRLRPLASSIKRVYSQGEAFSGSEPQRAGLGLLADGGARVSIAQHGGGAIYQAHSSLFLERRISDEYLVWGEGVAAGGSAGGNGANSVRVLPSTYLAGLRGKRKTRPRWDALCVVLEEGAHIKWLYSPLYPDLAHDYFQRERTLFDLLCSGDRRVAFKVYRWGFGWGQARWLHARYPQADLLVEGSFIDYSLKSRLVIVDYLSTAFFEMIAMGHPFLATWNRRWFRGNAEFEPLLDGLADAGIFHEEPERLMRSFDEAVRDPEAWWAEPRRREAVARLAERFSPISDRTLQSWREELTRA